MVDTVLADDITIIIIIRNRLVTLQWRSANARLSSIYTIAFRLVKPRHCLCLYLDICLLLSTARRRNRLRRGVSVAVFRVQRIGLVMPSRRSTRRGQCPLSRSRYRHLALARRRRSRSAGRGRRRVTGERIGFRRRGCRTGVDWRASRQFRVVDFGRRDCSTAAV